MRALKVDVRKLCNIKFAVIGSGTAGILENTAFCRYYSKGLYFCGFGKSFGRYGKQNERVLILRAENGSKELTEILSRNNIIYDDVKTYDIQSESKSEGGIITSDYITFASSSGVNAFLKADMLLAKTQKLFVLAR